ncbi:MAG: DUF192 domain-containing protein [Patescibacteria group bacterium]
MKKYILMSLILILTGCSVSQISTIEINNKEFKVILAQTEEEHFQGLSSYTSLDKNTGMLFVFDDYKIRNFVMRDMNFPLDIVWIKDDMVVYCEQNVQIFDDNNDISRVNSLEAVNYVLEVNAGICEEYNILNGDSFEMNF